MERKLDYRKFRELETGMVSGDETAIEELFAVMEAVARHCES